MPSDGVAVLPWSPPRPSTSTTSTTTSTRLLLLLIGATALQVASARSVLPSHTVSSTDEGDTVVHTRLGSIRGVKQRYDDISLGVFLGVPYARPPIGARRFSPPEMVEKWAGELEARVAARTCVLTVDTAFPQFPGAEMWNPPDRVTEDCLHLNIWVPSTHDGTVLVWIYGGGFFSGSPSLDLYDGSVLAAKHNAIVVNINYRLGPFGFLYLGPDSPVPGNVGLLDQQLALKWIHEHIGSFGGDPKRVTLFGESAGAASVTAHLLAPDSHPYFNKIIAKSGAIVNSWATRTKDSLLDMSLQLARRLNCTDGKHDTKAIHACLRDIPGHVIQAESDRVGEGIALPMSFAFVPVVEDVNFFKGNVFEKVRRRDFKKDVSAIMGSVKDEGTYWLPYYMAGPEYGFLFNHTISPEDPVNKAFINKAQYRRSLESFMPYFGNSPLVQHALMNAYLEVSERSSEKEKLRDGVARFLGDYFFTCGVVEFADMLSDHIYGPVYMYYFTMRSSANPWPRWMGVMHGYEIEYFFGLPYRRPHLYDKDRLREEQAFSGAVMKMWAEFANHGSPGSFWPKYNRVERKSLELGAQAGRGEMRVSRDVHGSHCRLIDESRAVVGQISDCRARRTGPVDVVLASKAAAGWSLLPLALLLLR